MKCNVCGETKDLEIHPFIAGAYVCEKHKPKGKAAKDLREMAPPLFGSVVVDRKELFGLKAEGLLSLRAYIYFALRIDGVNSDLKRLDLNEFSQRWNVRCEDCVTSLAQLSKKGIVQIDVKELNAAAFTHEDRLKALENAYAGDQS